MILTLHMNIPNIPEKWTSFLMMTYIRKIGFSYAEMKTPLFNDLEVVTINCFA